MNKLDPTVINDRISRLKLFFAKRYSRVFPPAEFIVVAGSVGKSSVTEAVKEIFKSQINQFIFFEGVNLRSKIASSLLKVRSRDQKIILELNIENDRSIDDLLQLAQPTVVILTQIDYDQSGFFDDLSRVINQYAKLLDHLPADGVAILNYDDIHIRKLAEKTTAKVLFFGTDPQSCHLFLSKYQITNFNSYFEMNYGVERVEVKTPILGFGHVLNLLASSMLGLLNGLSLISIRKGLERLEPSEHKLQLVEGYNESVVIDDTYNISQVTIEEGLDVLNQISARRRMVVFGEIKNLGSSSEKIHQEIALRLYKDKIDLVFLSGGQTNVIADELLKLGFLPERIKTDLAINQISSQLLNILAKGDAVLLKGSKDVRLDEVVKRLVKKNY